MGAQIFKYNKSPRTPIQGVAQRNVVSIKKWTNNPKREAQNEPPRTPLQCVSRAERCFHKKSEPQTQPRSTKTPKRTKERYLL